MSSFVNISRMLAGKAFIAYLEPEFMSQARRYILMKEKTKACYGDMYDYQKLIKHEGTI